MIRQLSQIALACAVLMLPVRADPAPVARRLPVYDELADAHRDVMAAVRQAADEKKLVLVVFGANWCPDCRAFDEDMNAADLGSLLAEHYVVVKVDVGRFKKNLDVAARYGMRLRKGIPAAVVVSAEDKALLLVEAWRLSAVRQEGRAKVVRYFDAALIPEKRALLNQ
ncbi:MAG: thioredoxin family protein [Hyphomicrobiaceae bacterium]